jgi:alkylation response protein AidB-like acyl-CoA dehydrogenase
MDFELTEEQKMLQNSVKEWAQKEFSLEYARKCDQEHIFPKDLILKAAKQGFIAATIPEKYGGQGLSVLSFCLLLEQLATVELTLAIPLYCCAFGSEQIERFGNEEQKMKYLPKTASGEWIACAAYTEPDAGTDLQAITSMAEKKDNAWVINGEKIFITNAPVADYGLALVRTAKPEKPRSTKGMSMLVVDDISHRNDVQAKDLHPKMGFNATLTGDVFYDDCKVPLDALVGEEGRGFYQAMSFFDLTRLYVATLSLGAAQAALNTTIAYIKDRKVFGQALVSFEHIQFQLAEDAMKIELARNMIYKAAWSIDIGEPNMSYSSMAKYCTTTMAEQVLRDAIQFRGGYGYMADNDVERWYRDNRVLLILEGANKIQLYTIASALLR